jgi:hypothetical protein
MDTYKLSVFAHLVLAIVLVGQALFWFIMSVALRQRFDKVETERYLAIVNGARWPHVVVPYNLRIPLSLMSWLVIGLLVATGFLLLVFRAAPENVLWWTKIGLLTAIVVVQVNLSQKPTAAVIRLNMILTLAIIVVAGWAIR